MIDDASAPVATPPVFRIVNETWELGWLTSVSTNGAEVGVITSLAGSRPMPVRPAEVESAGPVATI